MKTGSESIGAEGPVAWSPDHESPVQHLSLRINCFNLSPQILFKSFNGEIRTHRQNPDVASETEETRKYLWSPLVVSCILYRCLR